MRIVSDHVKLDTLANVAAYPSWVRLLHRLNIFDLSRTQADIRSTRGRFGGPTRDSGHFAVVVLLMGKGGARHVMVLKLSWEGTSMIINMEASGQFVSPITWTSATIKGEEYIWHASTMLADWLDAEGFEVIA